jgi:hypothetical protein
VIKPRADSYPHPDQRNGHDALRSLTWAERILCGRLILRQLNGAPRIQQELGKYGPEGTVRLCSARAFWLWEVLLGIVAGALGVSGQEFAGLIFVILFLLAGAVGMIRLVSAAKAGRRWRSANSGRSEE